MKLKNVKHITTAEGESVTIEKSFSVKANSTEEFYMTFVPFMASMLKLKSFRDIKVLTKLCTMMEFDKNTVLLPASRRKEVCSELEINNTHLSNSIKNLKQLGILVGEGGQYEVNPILFWKGTTDTRNKLLKTKGLELRIKFSSQGPEDLIENV